MGTFATINIENNLSVVNNGFELLKDIENNLSSYIKTSQVSILNNDKKIEPSKYLKEILTLSNEYYKDTNGYFDISIGTITKDLYKFGTNSQRLPSQEEIRASNLSKVLVHDKYIHINSKSKIDLGGIAKGYAIDKLYNYLIQNSTTKGILKLSGDIRCIDMCEVYIQSPIEENATLMKFKTNQNNISISTSGTYNRYIKNKKNHHLINPKTKYPAKSFISVTLISHGNNTKIDAYATAVSVMPIKIALDFLSDKKMDYILMDVNKKVYKRTNLFINLF